LRLPLLFLVAAAFLSVIPSVNLPLPLPLSLRISFKSQECPLHARALRMKGEQTPNHVELPSKKQKAKSKKQKAKS